MSQNGKGNHYYCKKYLSLSGGTARHRLVRSLMFQMAQECGMDICHQCGEKITDIKDFSVEHKIPWLYNENSIELYFNPENIAFSHYGCNSGNGRTTYEAKSKTGYKGVYLDKRENLKKRYVVNITVEGKKKTIGHYETALEAAKAYDDAATIHQGDRAVTNKMLGLY